MANGSRYHHYEDGFSASDVVRYSVAVLGKIPVTTLGIAILLAALPTTVLTMYLDPTPETIASGGSVWNSLTLTGCNMLFSVLAQGAIIHSVHRDARGEKALLGESIGAGLSAVIPLFALSILMTLGFFLGALLFIIPAFMLMMMWAVATPALVIERNGIFASFSRSRDLTDGVRWSIFGIYALIGIAAISVTIVVAKLASIDIFSGVAQEKTPLWFILTLLQATLTVAYTGTLQASLFIALREWKDGRPGETLENVFA